MNKDEIKDVIADLKKGKMSSFWMMKIEKMKAI